MHETHLKRRDFHGLTMAALGGLVAGAGSGSSSLHAQEKKESELSMDPALLAAEPLIPVGA